MDKTIHSDQLTVLRLILRERREAAGLRQAQVAERLSEPQSFVSKYESGERRLDLIELRQVCAALGVDLLDLIGDFLARTDA